jgi:pSer/pThr/pTyr-binding forkhead associated (FHA) protein
MSLKSWVLHRVHDMNGIAGRNDLPPREPDFQPTRPAPEPVGARIEGVLRAPASESLGDPEHLGAYGPLIGAIRDELEHFVASHVRLHVVIADRDRFVLTSIGVRCAGSGESRRLLQQFMHEFKPEQVKRYLAREVIAGLPNASAIDLSQFAGLFDAETRVDAEEGGEYRELLAALRTAPPAASVRPYEVSVVGRWTEIDVVRASAVASPSPAGLHPSATPSTPMAGQRSEFDVHDTDGRRRVVLQAVVPGRRYLIGKGEGCDIRVSGTYTSRRHAEIWLDRGAWWVGDAGSTNGIRVESQTGPQGRSGAAVSAEAEPPVRLDEDALIVLSARAEGPPADYPTVAMRPLAAASARLTPIAVAAAPKTPLTAILPVRDGEPVFKITALQATGLRTLELSSASLPVTIGRSRNQTLVVDRRHDGVSGHHLDIVALDDDGADVVVHGDNGISIGGRHHAPGAHCRWHLGESMLLGTAADDPPACTLQLTRQDA